MNSTAIEKAVKESLPRRVQIVLSPIHSADWSELRRYDIDNYRITGTLTKEELDQAIAAIDAAHIPADRQFVTKEVTRLLLSTKGRSDADDDLRMRMAIFIEELADFPADAVMNGCRAWARANTWAPSLAEILKECSKHCERRKAMRSALHYEAIKLGYRQS